MKNIRSQGFSLIEVMVAVLITAVGILGVAGMQVISLQQNRDALIRDQALQAGNDILDRMRANPETTYTPVAIDDAPASTSDCTNNICNRFQLMDYDIGQWKCRINPLDADGDLYSVCGNFGITQTSLPGGQGSILVVAGITEVTIKWIHDRDGNTSSIILRSQ